MTEINTPNVGKRFLAELDEYLAKNQQKLTCDNIHNIYYQFFLDLKEFKGNSNGFTGLSEYLIFRLLYHLIGGSFNRNQITPDLWEFSNTNNDFRIGQSSRVTIGNKKYYPDIVIYNKSELIAVIQIKLYATKGCKEIDNEVQKLINIRQYNSKTRALLIIFGELSTRGTILSHIQKIRANYHEWFEFLILKNNKMLLAKVLQNWIGLEKG